MGDGLSVVVPTRNRPAHLERCLASIRAALGPDDELLVVDSFSTDPAVGALAAAHADRWLRAGRPGASLARNLGWRAAAHDVVAFVDDDVTVASGWAEGLRVAARRPGVAFVAGRIGIPPDQMGVDRPVALKDDLVAGPIDAATTGTLGHSANLAVRRAALDAVHGFDELLGAGAPLRAAEDNDLFDRLLAAGFTGWYEPTAAAWHDQWRTRGELVRLDWAYGVGTGARLAKLRRADPGRAREVATESVWRNGLRLLPGQVRHRYELGVATTLARVTGAAAGYVRARRLGVDDGHLVAGATSAGNVR